MTDQQPEGPGEKADPIPRDMPDQQAHEGEDPWDVRPGEDDADVPDTDEAGTGRQGAPQSGAVHPEHPVPDESTA
ncbi:hypothetical protein [Streptomyces sp. TP-A0356]|uniref:hypothetical protein n=1 Tax=Streptomyces sp. TP-A0356 TaxID=1359208 RepID=UPI0006E34B25|nr:hypothetical protein [Streptomyces sp. TP-A0356]